MSLVYDAHGNILRRYDLVTKVGETKMMVFQVLSLHPTSQEVTIAPPSDILAHDNKKYRYAGIRYTPDCTQKERIYSSLVERYDGF